MSFPASLFDLFCKKRKSPQSSHSSSPPKETSRTHTVISSSHNGQGVFQPSQGGPNERLKENIQTQLILNNKEKVSRCETKNSQRSVNMKSGKSDTMASPLKKKENDIQTKEEKHEKVPKIDSKVEDFMQGEGLKPTVRKPKINQRNQKESCKKEVQEKSEQQKPKEKGVVEAKDVQELQEYEFSDGLSYQSSASASGSLADFDMMSQVESEYVLVEEKRPIGSPERKDFRRDANAKITQNMKRTKTEALEELKSFPLRELKMTKEKYFDTRRTLTKQYLALCEEAGENARSYYYNEIYKPENQGNAGEKKEESIKSNLEKSNDEEAALKELKEFSLSEVKLTKEGHFDKRFKQTKIYLNLCEKAKKDPEQYYKENKK